MIEVIPNWHPLFVHFPIALLSMATVFFIALFFVGERPPEDQLRTLAYWNLWIGTGFAIIAAIAGWFAFNSVAHDSPSHAAMTDHRNWALVTLSVYIVMSIWGYFYYKSERRINMVFTLTMFLAFILLVSTGWRGSEVVYRYGLGVMSLPKAEGDGHDHEHAPASIGVPSNMPSDMNKNGEHADDKTMNSPSTSIPHDDEHDHTLDENHSSNSMPTQTNEKSIPMNETSMKTPGTTMPHDDSHGDHSH